jgi:malate dehydrogenase
MTMIQIFGMGNVGSTLAYRCACELDDIHVILTDIDKARMLSEVSDINQACLAEGLGLTRVSASDEVVTADIYVICASAGLHKDDSDRTHQLESNRPIISNIVSRIADVRHEMSMTLIITNPSHTLAAESLRMIPFVLPTGNILDNTRLSMCKVTGQHEKPDIQSLCDDVKRGKGCTQFGPVSEAMLYIRGYMDGFESP